MSHIPQLLGEGFDMIKNIWTMDDCMSDRDFIDQYAAFLKDIVEISTVIIGFDRKFDLHKKLPHYSKSEFEAKTSEYQEKLNDDEYMDALFKEAGFE